MIADVASTLHTRLARDAERRWPGASIGELRPLEGGHSGLTHVVELERPGLQPLELVVKSTPPGRRAVGRHDVLRQARIIGALNEGSKVRVPAVWLSDASQEPYFCMTRVAGAATEPVLDGDAGVSDTVWEEILGQLAALADSDPALAGAEEPLGLEAELERWRATAAATGFGALGAAILLERRLADAIPSALSPRLVHGDYRLGNALVCDGRIEAVIDWEIWSLSDPRIDLGWLWLFSDPAHLPGLATEARTAPGEAALLQAAARHGLELADIEWFCALACFKLAAVQAHNLERHRRGSREDPYLERWEPVIPALAERGAALLG